MKQSKIDPIYRAWETSLEGASPETIKTFKACFYSGALACAWRIRKHLIARGKYDAWMAELMLELDEAIYDMAATEFLLTGEQLQ